jgi:hydroxymethylglutaryl-CoA reductase
MGERWLFTGFSKLALKEKKELIASLADDPGSFINDMKAHLHPDSSIQQIYMHFSENVLTNFFLPYGIAPNFLVNGKIYHVPMVTEESSVVAAAASAAKFWSDKGGFHCEVISTIRKGQVHFCWKGDERRLKQFFDNKKNILIGSTTALSTRMIKRGAGIKQVELLYLPEVHENYFQLDISFKTADAMGANFMNSCLELIASEWEKIIETNDDFEGSEKSCEIIMSILSNYSPDCIVNCRVEAEIDRLNNHIDGYTGREFAKKFALAIEIARQDVQRAVTHNKGIFNGIDAVVLATGNDFRAVEANGHAYAARDGKYRSLSAVEVLRDKFIFMLELPLMIGTVGGITDIHPLARRSIEVLGKPSATELMQIAAAVGLANNYSAIKSLISGGIQAGHMKLHLSNIMVQLGATNTETEQIKKNFKNRKVSYSAVREYLSLLRNQE